MFNVVEGLIKDSKYVTPSHINRLWPLIVSLVDVGCTNLTISNKQLMEAIKYEFCQDPSAQTPKPFEIQCSNAADHVCSILYVLRAFYRESKADEVDMERGNRNFKKRVSFGACCNTVTLSYWALWNRGSPSTRIG
jgi:hypothetical protein